MYVYSRLQRLLPYLFFLITRTVSFGPLRRQSTLPNINHNTFLFRFEDSMRYEPEALRS